MFLDNLLYKREIKINDKIKVIIPLVRDIVFNDDVEDAEEQYYSIVSMVTAMPIDMMVQLDDIGIDFTEINEFELFVMIFGLLKKMDTRLVFGDLDLNKFEVAINEQNGEIVLVDRENDIVIDKLIHRQIAESLCKIHHIERNTKKPGNKEARDYLIERARKKQKRHKSKNYGSQLEPLIISMVNTEQYKYNYADTLDLTIYQFNESVSQIIKKVDYDNRMHGVYAGTVDAKELSQDQLTWLKYK